MDAFTLLDAKRAIRNGKWAWPGGYPLFFITTEGEVLSFEAVRDNWRRVVRSHLHRCSDGWQLAGVDVNWEDEELTCDHTGERIESAYRED